MGALPADLAMSARECVGPVGPEGGVRIYATLGVCPPPVAPGLAEGCCWGVV